jgi:hypothetical protein
MAPYAEFIGSDGKGRTVTPAEPLPVDIGSNVTIEVGASVEVSNDVGNPLPVSGTINTLTGLDIPKHDNIQLTYTGTNLTGVAYKVGVNTVATLTLAYTGSRLDSVTKS